MRQFQNRGCDSVATDNLFGLEELQRLFLGVDKQLKNREIHGLSVFWAVFSDVMHS